MTVLRTVSWRLANFLQILWVFVDIDEDDDETFPECEGEKPTRGFAAPTSFMVLLWMNLFTHQKEIKKPIEMGLNVWRVKSTAEGQVSISSLWVSLAPMGTSMCFYLPFYLVLEASTIHEKSSPPILQWKLVNLCTQKYVECVPLLQLSTSSSFKPWWYFGLWLR